VTSPGDRSGAHGDNAAVLWARRCERCGWLDQSREWESEEAAARDDADGWACERCGGRDFRVVSTVGG
jgi:hypothetical protein